MFAQIDCISSAFIRRSRFVKPDWLRAPLMALICATTVGCNAIALKNPESLESKAGEKVESASLFDMEYLAAVDLINTLVQVPRLHPANTPVLQMKRPTPGFGQNVLEVMKIAGYNIQIVDTGVVREPRVSFSRTLATNSTTFQINIEEVKARRAYAFVGNQVKPDSSVYIFGADPDSIETNDHIFENFRSVSRTSVLNSTATVQAL